MTKHHQNCGGVVRFDNGGGDPHYYCDTCYAFRRLTIEEVAAEARPSLPNGANINVNAGAWRAGDMESPEAQA